MKKTPSLSDSNAVDSAESEFSAEFSRRVERKIGETLRRDDPPRRKFLGGTVVVQTTSCGRGLFANRSFAKNVPVGRVRGLVVDDVRYSSDYCVDAGGSLSLEPDAPFCYLNHSCDPNCAFYRYSGPDDEEESDASADSTTQRTKNGSLEKDAQDKENACDKTSRQSFPKIENKRRKDKETEPADFVVEECSRTTCVGCPDAERCESFAPELGKVDADFPIWQDDDVEIWVETLRSIEVGDELTIDYSWGLDRAIPCACGSPKCRGWIVDPTLLPDLLAQKKKEKTSK